ncbi:MAG: antibiotic biosynthesis monooxygenase [Geobacteraceae bacterium]|nr:antibiotic biosynthesis monooxygenase [Geobacteraceae bacterium]
MAKVTVVAKLTVREDAIELVRVELLKMIAPTRQEEGCIEYRLHQDNENPAGFIFYENWQNLECLMNHLNSAHYQAYVAAVGDLIIEKIVHKMTEIA